MNREPAKLDNYSIEYANRMAKDQIAHVRRLAERYADSTRDVRLMDAECVVCWGASRIGGAASTHRPCAFCGLTLHSGSWNIDALCLPCATKNGLCKHCGADLDLKNRRKPRTFQERLLPEAR